MILKIKGETFRVDYEGGTGCPGDRWTPPDYDEINVVSIEWKQKGRYFDVTELLNSEFLDEDEFEEAINEKIIELNEPDY